jgi:F-type H+-transporting ATPase subunit delta
MNQVVVTSAVKLDAGQKTAVKELVQQKLGQSDYELRETVNPAVIGGIRIQINSRIYDATLLAKLNALREASR